MDNASKALIMAGAVLISIALVGVGVYIFSSTNTMVGGANKQLDDAAAQMTNSTLGQYAGTKVRGSIDYKSDMTITDTAYYTVTVTDSNSDGYYDKVEVSAYNAKAGN